MILSGLFLCGDWGEVVTDAFDVPHSQLRVCSHLYRSSRSFLAHGRQQQQASWTSPWFLTVAQNMYLNMASVAAWTTEVSVAAWTTEVSVAAWTTDVF